MEIRIEDNVIYCGGFKLLEVEVGENKILTVNVDGIRKALKQEIDAIKIENVKG